MDRCPPEISRDILLHLAAVDRAGSEGTFRAAALACRAWTAVAQEQLFRSVTLKCSAPGALHRLAHVLRENTALAAYIRTVIIDGTRGQGAILTVPLYHELVAHFAQATHLTLNCADWRKLPDLSPVAAFAAKFASLESLKIRLCRFRSIDQLGTLLVHTKATLRAFVSEGEERLLLEDMSPSDTEISMIQSSQHIPWRIASLSISDYQPELLGWLARSGACAATAESTLTLTQPLEVTVVVDQLFHIDSSLQSLTLGMTSMKIPPSEQVPSLHTVPS
jgi:hypothetical protein